jgi:hypothetical protein
MQITLNSTRMAAGLSAAVDKDGRDYCVVVVKGTYLINADGTSELADEQEALVLADRHLGEPSQTSILYECEFAPFKPRSELIFNAVAHAPGGKPVTEMLCGFQFGSIKKTVKVLGDRVWQRGVGGVSLSAPQPFVTMPLVYERAFGGSDHSHESDKYHGTELRNPIGAGFGLNPDAAAIEDRRLPNVENPRALIASWSDTPAPVGFGSIGRNWHPRVSFAGTYDGHWLNERAPFLPADFDNAYFLSAPHDQQFDSLRGKTVLCLNMAPQSTVACTLPGVELQVLARFATHDTTLSASLDTAIIEPDRSRFLAIFRAAIPLGRKIHALREVQIGAS